jgi:hypothetical protein
MSIKSAEDFLKKNGFKKKKSKFEKYKDDILYLHNEGATLEIITQYLETKGIERTKGYTALASFIKRNKEPKSNQVVRSINSKKDIASNITTASQEKEITVNDNVDKPKSKIKTYTVNNQTRSKVGN